MPYIAKRLYMGDIESLVSDMAYIVIFLISPEGGGFARQDAILKAKYQLGINRPLTEEEKTLLAQKIQLRYPNMLLSDLMWYINLAETMPGFSSGGMPADTPDVILPNKPAESKSFLVYLALGLLLFVLFRKK
jgi:hypothetical protein